MDVSDVGGRRRADSTHRIRDRGASVRRLSGRTGSLGPVGTLGAFRTGGLALVGDELVERAVEIHCGGVDDDDKWDG
jgi:hypothetical protein